MDLLLGLGIGAVVAVVVALCALVVASVARATRFGLDEGDDELARRRGRRRWPPRARMFALALLAGAALAACGLPPVARGRVALLPAAVLATAAHEELPRQDRERQASINREEALAGRDAAPALAAYREVRDGRARPALSALSSAVRAAARALDAAEEAIASGSPIPAFQMLVESALEAMRALSGAMAAAKLGVKEGP